jgi:hypothetical protein
MLVHGVIAMLLGPVADERCLFLAFDLKLDVRRFDWSGQLDEDLSIDHVAWLVEWELSLQLHLSRWEVASFVLKIKHCLLNQL